ncbi:MAG: hypothetical protein J5977_09695 [Fibrobacter sp.]|nr:hypothetical protein [Fibrobacter sp.]
MRAQEELERVRNLKNGLILSIVDIRNMVNEGVVVSAIGNNTIVFAEGNKPKPFKFKSGCYAEISPSEIRGAKSYFKKECQQELEYKAGEYDRLEKEEKMWEKLSKKEEDF